MKTRGWRYRISSPHDLLLQLFSLQRGRAESTDSENTGDDSANSAAGRDLMEVIVTFNANNAGSSDDGGDSSGPEDFCS